MAGSTSGCEDASRPSAGCAEVRFIPTPLAGAYIVELEKREDERGFFARGWCAEEAEQVGLNPRVVQSNISFNHRAGTIRGLHYQRPPFQEAKLVRCIDGAIHDVIVDLRRESNSFGKWFAADLTRENRLALYVPEGFAHGFQTLEDGTEVLYSVSAPYHPEAEGGIRFDDERLGIVWPLRPTVVSQKDRLLPRLGAREEVLR